MKAICLFILMPFLSQAQILTPMDLYVLGSVSETNSLPVMNYTIGTLSSGQFKFVSVNDSLSSDRKHRFYNYTFSSGATQTIVLTSMYSVEEEVTYGSVTYNVFDEDLYKVFERQLKDYGFSIVGSSIGKDGVPFQMWSYETDNPNYYYLKIYHIMILKYEWGYMIIR